MTTVDSARSAALDELRAAMVELLGAERRLRAREQQRPTELTSSQLRALSALAQQDAVPAGELAKSADLNPASVTPMLDQLEASGIIERKRTAPDRRVCLISLTGKGRAVLEARREQWHALWDRRFRDWPEPDLAAASSVIRELIQMLEEL
jgi:DNA-binding MarR family transcriptional regulator